MTIFGLNNTDVKKWQFFCDGEKLEIVQSFKYLSVVFNYIDSFKDAMKKFCKQAWELCSLCYVSVQSLIYQ